MKPLQPGQVCTIGRKLYRAHKATAGCAGCAFDSIWCPNIQYANVNNNAKKFDCGTHSIILKLERL